MKKLPKIFKIICLFMVSIAVFAFFSVGCSKNKSNEQPNPPSEGQQAPDNGETSDDENDEIPSLPSNATSYETWQHKYLYEFYNGSYIDYINELETDDNISSATKKALCSVVELKTSGSTGGSGIIFDIDKNNNVFIITNYHVVYNYETFTANLYGSNEKFSLQFIGGSATYDIAVLYGENVKVLESQNAKAATFNLDSVEINSVCLALGNTNLKGIKTTKGKITTPSENYTAKVAGYETKHRFICHSAYITNGNSGGGLFNENGDFIGITNGGLSSDKSVKLAIPASIIYSSAKNIIANCFNSDNKKIIECSLGLSLTSIELVEPNEKIVKINSLDSTLWTSLQVNDQLVSFKITTDSETITKTVSNEYDLSDYKMLLIPNSNIELTLMREGVSENIVVKLYYNNFKNNTIN